MSPPGAASKRKAENEVASNAAKTVKTASNGDAARKSTKGEPKAADPPAQMKSGSAHCDLELADEARQCPLQSGAGEEAEAAEAAGVAEAAGDASLIKSSNPHLAGGEKMEEGLQVLEHSYAGRARLVEPVDVTREARKLNEFKFNVRQMKCLRCVRIAAICLSNAPF